MVSCNVYLCDTKNLNVEGVISFENAVEVMQAGIKFINQSKVIDINLSNLKHSDSSGLAVISSWVRYANKHNKILTISAVPKFLLDLSKVSNLEEIFPAATKS